MTVTLLSTVVGHRGGIFHPNLGRGKRSIIATIDGQKRGISTRFSLFLKDAGDYEWQMIDGSVICAHRHAAGARGGQEKQGLGRSCGGFSSKIHAKVDVFGVPLVFAITAGQVSDMTQAEALIGEESCQHLVADKGYDSDAFRAFLREKQVTPVIPGRSNRTTPIVYDTPIYKERNAVERFFGRLKEHRRIATRFDKTAVMFKAGLVLASILMWLKI